MASPISPAFSRLTEADIRRFSVELTSAQILALHTTPVTLIAAPGVGQRIVPLNYVFRLIGGSVAYLDGGGGAVSLQVGATAVQNLATNAIVLVTVAPNKATETLGASLAAIFDTAGNPPDSDNQPLTLNKATANFTAGNGTMHISGLYMVEPTS
jgi:hypothetical protein